MYNFSTINFKRILICVKMVLLVVFFSRQTRASDTALDHTIINDNRRAPFGTRRGHIIENSQSNGFYLLLLFLVLPLPVVVA